MDRNMSTNAWMEYNNSPYCKVDIWKNDGSLYYDSSNHTIYDGSITTNTGLLGANLLTMNDHSYQSNKIRVRLHGGSQDIQVSEILLFVTGI